MSRRATLLDSRLNQLKFKNMNVNTEEAQVDHIPKTLLQKFWQNSVPILGLGEKADDAKSELK